MSRPEKSFLDRHSLSLLFLGLTVVFTFWSLFFTLPEKGFKEWFQDYTNNGSTEMLQLFLIVWLTKFFREEGSAESKD